MQSKSVEASLKTEGEEIKTFESDIKKKVRVESLFLDDGESPQKSKI